MVERTVLFEIKEQEPEALSECVEFNERIRALNAAVGPDVRIYEQFYEQIGVYIEGPGQFVVWAVTHPDPDTDRLDAKLIRVTGGVFDVLDCIGTIRRQFSTAHGSREIWSAAARKLEVRLRR